MNTKLLCHNAVILIAVTLLLSAGPGCGKADNGDVPYDLDTLQPGERALVTLPFEFDVVPSNRFYVDGVLIEHAHLTTEEGDSLYLNGVPILPHRPCPKSPPHPEETYVRLYGDVPFVRNLMESGASARGAGTRYNALRDSIRRGLWEIYAAARESGADKQTAGETAFVRLKELDPEGLIDWDKEVRQSYGCIAITWKGRSEDESIMLADPHPVISKMPNEMAKRRLATRFYELLGRGGAPCWYILTCGGTSIAVGKNDVARMEAHLQEVMTTGVATDGALSRRAAREILANERR